MKLVNKTGYLKGAKTAKNPVNIIPSNIITTQNMAFPIKANGKTLYPNTGQYKFPTSHVVETPLKQMGSKSTKSTDSFRNKLSPNKQKEYDEYSQATKRGLSSEGLFDLGMGVTGEGIFNVAAKAGSRLYKAASPYIKNALKGSDVEKNIIKPWTITKENIKHLVNEYKRPMKPVKFNKTKGPLIHRDPDTGEIIYQIDPADYDNFSTPKLKEQALKDLEQGKKDWYSYRNKKQQEVVQEAQRIITPKQPLLKKSDFHTNSEVKKMSRNHKDYQKLENEINDIDPNIETEENLNKLFLTRPDLQKRWYDLADEGRDFNKKMLSPSQQKYLDKERGYVSGTSRPGLMPSGSKVNETLHPSPQELRKVKFPIQFGLGSMNKEGNKSVKSNLVKYKNGSKGVSLAFSRKEKDPKGGLTQKGVDKYNRATGGNLKMAVTTPPSKLKPGSKAANRRKSFCARMSGVKGPMAKNGKPTRKALALRKWNC